MGHCCKLLGVKSFVLAVVPGVQFQGGPVNFQLDKCFLCSAIFNIYMNAKMTLKVQSLENGLSCAFQAIGNILNIKQRIQILEETDSVWSQVCSSQIQL